MSEITPVWKLNAIVRVLNTKTAKKAGMANLHGVVTGFDLPYYRIWFGKHGDNTVHQSQLTGGDPKWVDTDDEYSEQVRIQQ